MNPARVGLALLAALAVNVPALLTAAETRETHMLIDNFADATLTSSIGTQWRGFSDRVMGGVSDGRLAHEFIDGRACLRLTGAVRLENNGGFVQAALDLGTQRGLLDASGYTGIQLLVRGNGEQYSIHLRTPDNVRPWQSYRARFTAGPEWQTVRLPFSGFDAYRVAAPLDTRRLRRIGVVAIGRAFDADVAVGELSLYR